MLNNGTVLHLRTVEVRASAANHDVVTYNRLVGHSIVSVAFSIVETVKVNFYAVSILDVHITVSFALDLGNDTVYEILLGSGSIVGTKCTCDGVELGVGYGSLGEGSGDLLGLGDSGVALADSSSNGDGYSGLVLRNGDGKSTSSIVNNDACVVGSVGKLNGVVVSAYDGKSDNGVSREASVESDLIKLELNLLSVGSLDLLEVAESINSCGDEVEVAVVKLDDTGYVCLLTVVCGVSISEGGLLGKRDTVVRGRKSYVGLVVTKLEVVVTVGSLLAADLNALDGYKERLLTNESCIVKSSCVSEDLGVVNGSYGGDVGVDDLNYCVNNLVEAVVGVLSAGNFNLHTYLEAEVCLRILGISETVDVVTAVVIEVLNVHTVSRGTVGLGEDTGDDTGNDYGIVILCCSVLCIRHGLVCRNLASIFLGYGVTICVRNGCLKGVCDFGEGLGIYIDGVEASLGAFLYGNACCINSPGYSIGGAVNNNLTNYVVVVRSCFSLVLVKGVDVLGSLCKARVFLATSGKDTEAEDSNEKKSE